MTYLGIRALKFATYFDAAHRFRLVFDSLILSFTKKPNPNLKGNKLGTIKAKQQTTEKYFAS